MQQSHRAIHLRGLSDLFQRINFLVHTVRVVHRVQVVLVRYLVQVPLGEQWVLLHVLDGRVTEYLRSPLDQLAIAVEHVSLLVHDEV